MRIYKSYLDPYEDWILSHWEDYNNLLELNDAIKEKFNIDSRSTTLRDWMRKKLGRGTIYNDKILWSDQEIEFIKTHYEKEGVRWTSQELAKQFNRKRSFESITGMAFRLGLQTTRTHCVDRSEIGSIRYDKCHDGITCKIKIGKGHNGWVPMHKYVWEQHNGKIPKGHRIIFLDGDGTNCDLSNLYCCPATTQIAVITNEKYASHDPSITLALIKYYELRHSLGITGDSWKRYERKYAKEE